MERRLRLGRRRGMSMVEIMVVIAILVTLMTLMALGVARAWEGSKVQLTKLTMGKVSQQVIMHQAMQGDLPTEAQGLEVVYSGEEVPRDAWSGEFEYERAKRDFDLLSFGKDGEPGGAGFAADLRKSELH